MVSFGCMCKCMKTKRKSYKIIIIKPRKWHWTHGFDKCFERERVCVREKEREILLTVVDSVVSCTWKTCRRYFANFALFIGAPTILIMTLQLNQNDVIRFICNWWWCCFCLYFISVCGCMCSSVLFSKSVLYSQWSSLHQFAHQLMRIRPKLWLDYKMKLCMNDESIMMSYEIHGILLFPIKDR